jgi:hypothetical protein
MAGHRTIDRALQLARAFQFLTEHRRAASAREIGEAALRNSTAPQNVIDGVGWNIARQLVAEGRARVVAGGFEVKK